MTEAEIRAEAAEAESEAHNIYAAMEAARNALPPDAYGSRPYIPAGFEVKAARASDLMRHARGLRADADEMRAERAVLAPPKLAITSVPVAISPNAAPAKASSPNAVDEVEAMVAAILASDQPPASRKCAPDVEVIVAAILASDGVHDGDEVGAAAQAILRA